MALWIWAVIGAVLVIAAGVVLALVLRKKPPVIISKEPVRVASLPPLQPTGSPGASIRATIVGEMSFYRIGDLIRFEFGTLNTDKAGGAINKMNIHAQLPDGTVGAFTNLEVLPGQYVVRYMDYIVGPGDLVDCDTGCRVRATMKLDGENDAGNSFTFYAEKSAKVEK